MLVFHAGQQSRPADGYWVDVHGVIFMVSCVSLILQPLDSNNSQYVVFYCPQSSHFLQGKGVLVLKCLGLPCGPQPLVSGLVSLVSPLSSVNEPHHDHEMPPAWFRQAGYAHRVIAAGGGWDCPVSPQGSEARTFRLQPRDQ